MKPNKANRPEMCSKLQVCSDQLLYVEKNNILLFIRSILSLGSVRDPEKDTL